MSRRAGVASMLACLFALAGCASRGDLAPAGRAPGDVRAQVVSLLPAVTADREGWATDIQAAFQLLDIPPSTENLCAVLAVTEQESTFNADPPVAGLARIARAEIDRRAAARKVPAFLVRAALGLESANGRSFSARMDKVRTERELSLLFEEFVARVPLGNRLFGDANPVRTGGPMQVSIAFAEEHVRSHPYPYPQAGSIRHEVFTRRGGLYFGIAHLLGYPNRYPRHLFRFADFNAGLHASRNAAFQAAVAEASGVPLVLDGDLVIHGSRDRVGATESAVRSLAAQLGMDASAIRRALERGGDDGFDEDPLYDRVFALAERNAGRALPREVIPTITLDSPKITRTLTTEWFATRVQARYQRCVNRAFGT